ncbi:PREDICTED: RAD51-associated protein 2 [Mesitornis unicolor]|uniref:RAD51-associated protein 2 n=1 Tax=Mesitornis unicolor TaxID=54374 RepID=UPI0005292F43|nr:PREDICTED: RAD51-associated protein 2 [Mesitornis unicolor]
MPPTNLTEVVLKNVKGQRSSMQSKQIHDVQKMAEKEKQKMQSDTSIVKALTVGSKFKEKSYPSISKQDHRALAEGRQLPATYFRCNSTDIECNQIFSKCDFKDKMLKNPDGDDDQKSRIHIYISAKNVQNDKCIGYSDLLKRMERKSSNENVGTFHIETSFPVITKALEKNKSDMHCGVHNSNSDVSLFEAESKLCIKEILDFKRYLTKTTIFENNCPHIIVQSFPDMKVSISIFSGKEIFNLKFSFPSTLFGRIRTWTESLCKDVPTCQDDSVTHWLHFHETLNKQCDAQELVNSDINRNYNDSCTKQSICLVAIILKHLKVELQRTILASFFSSTNTFLPAEVKSLQVEKHPLCSRKQDQLNSCTDRTSRQNSEFCKKEETYPVFVSSKFMGSIGFELQNEWQRRRFSRSLREDESTFLNRGTLFHNQKSRICKGRHVRRHHLLCKGSEVFGTYLRSVSPKNSMKKQTLVAQCLILLQGAFDYSSLNKMYCCNIKKTEYLLGANHRFWSYFPAHPQLKGEKVNSKCINQEMSVTPVNQEKKKPHKMFNSSFRGESLKDFPFVLCANKKHGTTRCRKYITSTNEVTNEVTYTMKKYLDTSGYINSDRKECDRSKELQINVHNFLSKTSFSIFDTYEKIPLATNSEDFDQIPFVNQDNSVQKTLSEENAVTSSKVIHNLPTKLNDILILLDQSETTMEKSNSLLLQDNQPNKPEYCKKIDTYSPCLANKKMEDQNTYSNCENAFLSSSNVYQSVTLPLDSSSFVNKDRKVSEDGHCGSSSSADKQNQNENIHATIQYPPSGSPTITDTYFQLQAKETEQFSLQGHTATNEAVSSEPATLKQHLEYVKQREDISDEQMHVTNESQCETVMNDLIMSYSADESKTFIAAEEELKMHLSVLDNGCLQDVKDKYLPLENKITYEFELKRKFDIVLEELHMFHEISKGDENNLSSLETNSHNNYCELNNFEGIDENVTSVSQKQICISSPISGTIEGQNITESNESSLNEKLSIENEDQKVTEEYCISRLSGEELYHSPVAEGYFDAAYKKPYTWDPAFLSCALKEQNYNLQKEGGYFLSREVIRLQPLKTCKGPIRIGLSKKARPKQLHPYLK